MIIRIINKIRYLIKFLNRNFIYYFFLTKKYKINKWHAFNNTSNRLYKREIISFCNEKNFQTVLDYGCGFGDIIKAIKAKKKFAYDNDPKIKKISKELFNQNFINFVNEKKLNSIKKTLDCVLFINFLHDYNPTKVKEIIYPFKDSKFILLDAIKPGVKGFKYFHNYNFMKKKYKIRKKTFEHEPDRSFFILEKYENRI